MAIRNVAMNAYQNAVQDHASRMKQKTSSRSYAAGGVGKDQKTDFLNQMQGSLKKVNELQSEKSDMIEQFASGEKQNVHELMISLQKAGVAMRMTSAVRNKVMQAYKELSRVQF